MSTSPHLVQVRGDGLTALAASLRLARLGHRVQLVSPAPAWRGASQHPLAAALPPALELPAVWRDLFAKTGRNMDAELAGIGLELVEAPPAVHRTGADSLLLPTERAGQLAAVREHYGAPAADAWRRVLDEADRAWQARRRFGLERPVLATPRRRDLPGPLADRRHPGQFGPGLPRLLGRVVADLGATRGGTAVGSGAGLLIGDLAVARVFGRWHLRGPAGPTTLQPLLDLLDRRLETRGVELLESPAGRPEAVVETGAGPAPRGSHPFLAPTVTLRRTRPAGALAGVAHEVEHTGAGPVGQWSWREGDDLLHLTHDHTRPVAEPRLGPAVAGAAAWRRRRPLRWQRVDDVATLMAGPASHGGPEPWAQLLTGALAAYRVHLRLTGVDVSPRNRAIGADGRPRPHLPPHLSA